MDLFPSIAWLRRYSATARRACARGAICGLCEKDSAAAIGVVERRASTQSSTSPCSRARAPSRAPSAVRCAGDTRSSYGCTLEDFYGRSRWIFSAFDGVKRASGNRVTRLFLDLILKSASCVLSSMPAFPPLHRCSYSQVLFLDDGAAGSVPEDGVRAARGSVGLIARRWKQAS